MSGIITASVIGAGASLYSSSKADKNADQALDAQKDIAGQQLAMTQEQWEYQRDVYQPFAMDLAAQNAELSTKVANQLLDDSSYYRGLSEEMTTQAKKSWEFQDKYMDMARAYADGTMGNTMANEANADVQQASAMQRGITQRNMARMGVNAGSGAGLAMQMDDQLATAAAGAGAQTQARKMARDKAEQMVGIAAGSVQGGFGTGLNAGGLSTDAANSATNASGNGIDGLNAANSGINQNYDNINAGFNGSANTNYGASKMYGGSPFADAISGIFTGLSKSGAGVTNGIMNAFNFGTSGNNYNGSSNDPYAANYENQMDQQSDVRLKDNIRLVGRSPRGYNWYAWTWKHDGSPSSGVIAQEVQQVDPGAVREGDDGFLRVDYTRV